MTNKTCINARMIANEKDTTKRWVCLALYHHLTEDNSPVDGRRRCKAGRRLSQPTAHSGSMSWTFTACQNVDKYQTTIWQKMSFWLNIPKHRFWLRSDVLTSFWVITLTKLCHYLLTWHIFSPVHLVVILNRLFVLNLRMLFVQTLRIFILRKGCLSKLLECLLCENDVCQNFENVYSAKKIVCPNSENVYFAKRFIVKTPKLFLLWKGWLSKLWECLLCGKFVCQNSENVCSLNPGRWVSPSPIISATQSAELQTEVGADMCKDTINCPEKSDENKSF